MASWLRTFAVLLKDLSLVPDTHIMGFTVTCNSSSRASKPLFWTPWALYSCVHTDRHAHLIKITTRLGMTAHTFDPNPRGAEAEELSISVVYRVSSRRVSTTELPHLQTLSKAIKSFKRTNP